MLPTIETISTNRTLSAYSALQQKIKQLLDYAATHPNAKLIYHASKMHLWAHSYASYLSESKSRSRAAGFAYLSDAPKLPIRPNDPPPPLNAPVDVLCKIIDAVMSLAQEAKTGAGFINARNLVPIRQALIEMGHPQGPTPLQFDNMCALGLLQDTVTAKRSKAMDMRFHWLRDRIQQGQFSAYWKPGTQNYADYPTKHHPSKNHVQVRPIYVSNAIQTVLGPVTQRKKLFQSLAKRKSSVRPHCKGVLTDNKVHD